MEYTVSVGNKLNESHIVNNGEQVFICKKKPKEMQIQKEEKTAQSKTKTWRRLLWVTNGCDEKGEKMGTSHSHPAASQGLNVYPINLNKGGSYSKVMHGAWHHARCHGI